ncbi:sulfatase family protein [Membranihabitans maritimus]|uniref:sulfatase family protein n=1 Tax=Membranihabitans maritimus TaxID=2904244 RepID=UPI001F48DBBF|nr:sulfatase [Membranihabitans maritimus]
MNKRTTLSLFRKYFYTPVIFLLSLLIFFNIGCKEATDTYVRPNIVWITSEDNSKHYMSLFDENGVETPNIEALAKQGIKFNHAFSNAPVCSVARSTIITGCYAPRIGAQFHRKMKKVPMPGSVKMFPEYLREAGYYTTNNSKEDYNLEKSESVWDESSKKATWRNRGNDQPFFHVFNITTTHESSLHFSREEMSNYNPRTEMHSFDIEPGHPETDLFRYTNAYYRDKIIEMDHQVGEVVDELQKDGLMENTIIFYYGDHGGVLPGSKGYLRETGLHVPMVVFVPEKYREVLGVEAGGSIDGFVSFIDLGPTVLNLAGIEVPEGMDGKPFLGANIRKQDVDQRNTVFGYADRMDEKYDMVRTVRKGKYKYMRSFQPFNFDALMNNYRYKQLGYQEWDELHREGKLNPVQEVFFKSRAPELLFDVEEDPYETVNLAGRPEFEETLEELREELNRWMGSMPDLSLYPEHLLIRDAFDNPVEFGQDNNSVINSYLEIANYACLDFDTVRDGIDEALHSKDPWKRYWALTVCSSFGERAFEFENEVRKISNEDPEALNRVRAAEYLGLNGLRNPVPVMTRALYAAEYPAEGLLILNSIVLMQDGPDRYSFSIEQSRIGEKVRENSEVKRRLEYLGIE